MSSHRLFAQLAFERALGHAALEALRQAVIAADQIATTSGDFDPWTIASELGEVVQDRIRDVLSGPGLGVVERGELFHEPRIESLVLSARDARSAPS